MRKNMGAMDKSVRVIIAVAIAVLYYMGIISDTLGLVLLIVAGLFLVTSLFSFCPLYPMLKINTRKKE